MSHKKSPLKSALTALLASSVALGAVGAAIPAMAQTATQTPPKAAADNTPGGPVVVDPASYSTQTDMLKTSDQAFAALTRVQNARLALFDNRIDEAKADVAKAKAALMLSESDRANLMMRDFTDPQAGTEVLPFGMTMALGAAFVPTDQSKAALTKAETQLQSGDRAGAVQTLRLADVDVVATTALLPYASTMELLDSAKGNLDKGAYFEANADLKAIADSVHLASFQIDAIPAQGAAG